VRATEQQRQRDILLGRQLRDELAELEDEPEAVTPHLGTVEQRRLARTARSHHGHDLAALHGDTRPAKGLGFTE
jgi:hypothetical protein